MKRSPLVWMLWLAVAVSGCSDSGDAQPARKKVTLQPTIKAPVEDPTKKMGAAVVVGKPTDDFQVKYQFGSKPEVSTLCPVEIALLASKARDDVEVAVTGMDGIELDGQLTKTFNLQTSEPSLMRFTVVPLRIGVFYVTVTTKVAVGPENVEEHAFAIPFIAGDLKAAKPPDEKMAIGTNSSVSQTTEKKPPGETK